MRDKKINKLIFGSLLSALCCICTMALTIPTPTGGYVHAGDAFVILAGIYLGPIYGGISAGIGSMLSDLLLGYSAYAPATFIIKFLAAFSVGFLYTKVLKFSKRMVKVILCGTVSSIIIVIGYFLFELLLTNNVLSAVLSGILGNLLQGLTSIVLSSIIINLIPKQYQ